MFAIYTTKCTPSSYYDSAPKCKKYGNLDRIAKQWGMIPKYKTMTDIVTPSGINVDTSGQ